MTGSPRIFDTLKNISFAIARLKQKDIIEAEDADEAIQFCNVIQQQLQEIVIVSKDPRELAIEEIISQLSITKYNCDFIELVKTACKNNEFVSRYIGSDFHVESNKKLRELRKRFLDGVHNRIIIISILPLVLGWKTDKNVQTDLTDQQKNEKQENSIHKNISSDTCFSTNYPESLVSLVSKVSPVSKNTYTGYNTNLAAPKTEYVENSYSKSPSAQTDDNSIANNVKADFYGGYWHCKTCKYWDDGPGMKNHVCTGAK